MWGVQRSPEERGAAAWLRLAVIAVSVGVNEPVVEEAQVEDAVFCLVGFLRKVKPEGCGVRRRCWGARRRVSRRVPVVTMCVDVSGRACWNAGVEEKDAVRSAVRSWCV